MTTIKNQKFGVEIEMTGITRRTATAVVAEHYGTRASYDNQAIDTKNRIWKIVYE